MRLKLLHAQRNALLGGVHFQDLGFHRLANRQYIGRLVHARPGNIGHVQQAVHAADIHERAEIGQAAHRAVHGLAFLHFGVALLLRRALFFFQHRAAVHHHVFIGHIELDDAAADLLADQLLHLGRVFGAAARGRHEGAHAHIHAQPALDHRRHRARDGGLIRERLFQRGPILRPLHLDARQLVVALRPAALDGNRQLVAALHGFAGVDELGQRNDAFDLVPDIDEDRFGGDRDYGSFETLLPRAGLMRVRLFVLGENIAEGLFGRHRGGRLRVVGGLRIRTRNAVPIQRTWVGHETIFHIVA